MVIYYDLVAFKFVGKEDYRFRDERGRNILLKKNDIIVLKEGIRSRYLDYKKHLFKRVSVPHIINAPHNQAQEENASQTLPSEQSQQDSQTQQTTQEQNPTTQESEPNAESLQG